MCKKEVAKVIWLQKFSKNASRKNVLQVGIADVNSDTSKLLTEYIRICDASCPAGSSTAATCPDVKIKVTKLSERQNTPCRSSRALYPSFFQLISDTATKLTEKPAVSKIGSSRSKIGRPVDFGLRNEFELPLLQKTKMTKSRVLASAISQGAARRGRPRGRRASLAPGPGPAVYVIAKYWDRCIHPSASTLQASSPTSVRFSHAKSQYGSQAVMLRMWRCNDSEISCCIS